MTESNLLEGVIARDIGQREQWLEWRKTNVNASEAACLWSDAAHPYLTAYKLWALRSGKIADAMDNKALKRGRLLEDDAIELLREERPGWSIWRPQIYLHHPEWRIGATPDAYATDWSGGDLRAPGSVGNVQIKTVGRYAFEKHWRDPDTREVAAPLWIGVQATIEAMLSGLKWAAVACMVISDGGLLDMHVVDVPIRPALLTNLRLRVADFWRRVGEADPYPIDFGLDVDTVFEAYRDDDGSQIDLSGDPEIGRLVEERTLFKELEKEGEAARKKRREIDAKLIARMGNAKIALYGDRRIVAMNIKKAAYQVGPQNYRFVRIGGSP